ncbi:MAG: hypothetical protein AAGF45_07520 [Pseudomonadota bacterium]
METRNIGAYAELHRQRTYGNTAVRMKRFIEPWVQLAAPLSILDYGAGQGGFVDLLDVPSLSDRQSYDPAIPSLSSRPGGDVDYVVCIDVLEHLEPEEVPGVLADIAGLSRKALIIVTTAPARAVLPDGRNAHTTIRPPRWWKARIAEAFGTAAAIPVFRKNRCGFKTYSSPPAEWLGFGGRYGRAELAYQFWRLRGGRFR